MFMCCMFSEMYKKYKDEKNRGSGSISDDYPSQRSTEGTFTGNGNGSSCCFERPQQPRSNSQSCPSIELAETVTAVQLRDRCAERLQRSRDRSAELVPVVTSEISTQTAEEPTALESLKSLRTFLEKIEGFGEPKSPKTPKHKNPPGPTPDSSPSSPTSNDRWSNDHSHIVRPSLGSVGPYLGSVRPYLGSVRPYLGSVRPYLGSVRPYLGPVRPSLGSVRPSLGPVRPSLGSVRPSLGPVRPSLGSVRPALGSVRPRLVPRLAPIRHRRTVPGPSCLLHQRRILPMLSLQEEANLQRAIENTLRSQRQPPVSLHRYRAPADRSLRTFGHRLQALPQHGHKHWQFYFSRTFDVYTKLWKYQQQHRTLLNEEYGLRRWQIGEIASKIGQLYYHFYLRTSEVTYLFDAYEFYAAIRGRGYYAKAADESNGDLMIKRLRYYTRFIVVSLLTRKLKFVEELISELDDVIMEYGDSYDPEDQIQWTMVSSEVKAFLAVECAIIIEDPECKKSLRTKTRLTPVSIPCIDKTPQMAIRLQKAVIIGSGSYQARVSELTIDMYRILQTIEREPVQSREVWQEPRNPFADGFDRAFNIETATANAPEKNLLFKPSPTQALVYIASACEDLSPIGALLLYISADGVSANNKGGEDWGFDTGGLITTSKSDIYGEVRASTPARYKEIQCLHPGDLQPFTRKPLFMIVDSDHSTIFLKMRRPFEMPMIILMSPTEYPPSLKEYENIGGLLTLFLYCPLGAVCRICSVDNVTADMWVEAQIMINNILQEAVVVAVRLPLDSSYISFLGDDFLRVQITRYIFCELVLRMHRGFVSRNHLPRASPPLPEQMFDNVGLTEMVLELASFLKIRNQFFNPLGSGGGPSN